MAITKDDLCRNCDGNGECECDECGHWGDCGNCLGTGFNPDRIDVYEYEKANADFRTKTDVTWALRIDGIKAGRERSDGAQLLAENFRVKPQ